ncbi:MAG TPA: PilW family protein [Telluria sp.]
MNSFPIRRARGFSLIELMISIVIGLLALMFATRLLATSEQNKQAALGGSDSMQNGMVAMFSISGDAAQAGWGLNDPLIVGCNTVFEDEEGFALATATRGATTITPLAPAVIESNGENPDRITLYSGSSAGGTATLRLVTDYDSGNQILVDRVPYGFDRGDVILVAPETLGAADCSLAQVSNETDDLPSPPAQQFLMIESGGAFRFNTGDLGADYTGSQSRLFNLGPAGQLSFHTWSVANGFLQLRSTDLEGSGSAPAPVADNIVSIKAQYGFDTRPAASFDPESGLTVSRWSPTMIDADGNGVIGSAGDYQRVAALRVAVVARARAPERAPAGGECTATPQRPVLFAVDGPAGVDAVPMTVNVAVANDAVPWQCYRYRVFENIVPLRNAAWRPTA